jgi:hypothetical protein
MHYYITTQTDSIITIPDCICMASQIEDSYYRDAAGMVLMTSQEELFSGNIRQHHCVNYDWNGNPV